MKKLLLSVIACTGFTAMSQNLLVQDMHFQNMNFINPSVGIADTAMNHDVQLYGAHRVVPGNDYSKNPTVLAQYIGNVDKIKGRLMAGYVYDQYSYFTNNTFQIGYATTLKKGNHHFDLGIRSLMTLIYEKVDWVTNEGEIKKRSATGNTDLDLGVQYRIKGWSVGVSAKNLFNNTLINNGYEIFSNERVFYMNASYEHTFGEKFKLAAFALPHYTTSFQIDFGVNAKFWNRLDVSYMLRMKELRHIARVSGMITKHLYAGISVGAGHVNSDIRTHAMIGYRF